MVKILSPNATRRSKMALIFIGVIAVVSAQVGGMTLYMKHFEEKVSTVEVVRAKKSIPRHTIITEADLEVVPVRIEDSVDGYLSSVDDLLGKEVTEPIALREQLTPQKYDRATKLPGQITIEIPTSWIISFPQSMRSWDQVALWEMPDLTKQNALTYQAEAQATTTQSADGTKTGAAVQGKIEILPEEKMLDEPFLKDVTVAFFKDATSNDVRDGSDTSPRMSSGSVGTKIEVNITPKQFGEMREKAKLGYKFIIGYY